jgi:hypothetical protein
VGKRVHGDGTAAHSREERECERLQSTRERASGRGEGRKDTHRERGDGQMKHRGERSQDRTVFL